MANMEISYIAINEDSPKAIISYLAIDETPASNIVITWLDIASAVVQPKRIGSSNKIVNILGTSKGSNITNYPRMSISFLEIQRIINILKGTSNRSIDLFGTAKGSSIVVYPRITISFLEINSPDVKITIGNSSKIVTIQGTSKGTTNKVAPTIVSISPADGATVVKKNTRITVKAVVTANIYPISKVEMFLDNSLQARDTISPYTFSWNLRNTTRGTHVISVKAYDTKGNMSFAQSTVKVI
jgi:hypothetical protein